MKSFEQIFTEVNMLVKKVVILGTLVVLVFALRFDVHAKLYVYEVVTDTRTFQTVSKLSPKSFLYYNGGTDIIQRLSIIDIYNDNEHSKAVEEYKLDESNVRQLPHSAKASKQDNKSVNDVNRYSGPNYWWR